MQRWRARQRVWIGTRHPRSGVFTTRTRTLYILPSRAGYGLLFFLIFIFLLAVNFENALVFGLFFWLLSVVIVNLHFTHHNLAGVSVRCVATKNASVDESVTFSIEISRGDMRARHAIALSLAGSESWQRVDLIDTSSQRVNLTLPVSDRGYIEIPRITLRSIYPLGIARCWSYARLNAFAVVYPLACDAGVAVQNEGAFDASEEVLATPGVADFESLRGYQSGDRLTRVHWPASSRGAGLQVKQFVDPLAREQWLRWGQFPSLPAEQRLQHLSFLVHQCEQQELVYGLSLPGIELPPDKGSAHRDRCLCALATFDKREPVFV